MKTLTFEEKKKLIEKGQFLERFVNDDDLQVRSLVARQGYQLSKLIQDESWLVRNEVANKGFRLGELAKDKSFRVRATVAKHGAELDSLIKDEFWQVRLEVAKQGYGLSQLASDPDIDVRGLARSSLDSKIFIIARMFGTYNGNLILNISNDGYQIISGCYRTISLDIWSKKCQERLRPKVSEEYTQKMREVLKSNHISN